MIWATKYLLSIEIPPELYLFSFGSTLFLYNAQRLIVAFDLIREPMNQSERHVWIRHNRLLLAVLTIVSGFAAAYAAFMIYTDPAVVKKEALFKVIFWVGLLSIAYAIPFMRWHGEWIRLRDLPGMKLFMIAFVWTVVVVGIPYLTADFHDPEPTYFGAGGRILFLEVFLFFIGITIPFDIRDMYSDKKHIRTIPQLLGEKKSIQLAVSLVIAVGIIQLLADLLFRWNAVSGSETIAGIRLFSLPASLVAVAWTLLSGQLVRGADSQKHEMYFSFLLDGLLLFLPAALFAVSLVQRLLES